MPPKKTVKTPTIKRNNAEKMPIKRTIKKETGKLNRPANLKVSIPLTNTTADGIYVPIVKGRRPPQFKRKLDLESQLELANSVARQQLAKNKVTAPLFEPDNVVYIHNPKIRKRTTRNRDISDYFVKHVVLENNTADDTVTSTATKPLVNEASQNIIKPRRIVTRKKLADSTAKLDAKRPKVEANTEIGQLNADKKVESIQSVDKQDEPDSLLATNQPQTTDVEQPQTADDKSERKAKNTKCPIKRPRLVPKKPPTIKRPVGRKKKTPKGKQETVTDAKISHSITKFGGQPDTSAPVVSRKSSTSTVSNLSWTRDISSSSTCITVSPHDFVRFDKKIPVLMLTNIDNELKKWQRDSQQTTVATDLDKAEDSSDSSDSECDTDSENDSSEQELNHTNSLPPSPFTKAYNELTARMKQLDMEIINWISPENVEVNENANLAKFSDKMFDILDNEFGIITYCRRQRKILEAPNIDDFVDETCLADQVSDKDGNVKDTNEKDDKHTDNALMEEVTEQPEPEFVKPPPVRKLSSNSEGNISNTSSSVTRDESSGDEPAENSRNSYYDHHDDDDALSLFAESISGFESTRMNPSVVYKAPVSNARPVEEYVPKPVKEDVVLNTEKHTYCPTKIREDPETITFKIICEKQNADSTSIYKQSISTDDTESYQDFNDNVDLFAKIDAPAPRLMDSLFEGLPKARSIVFSNLCFYNLMNCCRKVYYGQCRFLHMKPSCDEIKAKLSVLSERMLIQEYLLVRKWVELRRAYGMCYVEECAKRELTRVLVEMAYDFIVKARNNSEIDTRLRVDTIEISLLHLNTVDLSICEDLLKLVIHSDQVNTTLLCDVLMATMSITQNFSRFKIVFLNLTYFMVDNDRTFNKDVVEHILERVCILPFEEPIARALIQMMRLTKADIFNNSMIRLFEKQISINKEVFDQYSILKNQRAFTSMLASSVMAESPPLLEDLPPSGRSDGVDGLMAARHDRGEGQMSALADRSDEQKSGRADGGDGQPPAPSPDTTNLDKMNKSHEEFAVPIITRTIGMNPPIVINAPTSPGPSRGHEAPGSPLTHANPGTPSDDAMTLNVGKWRNRSIFPHMLPPSVKQPIMRAPSHTPTRPQRRQNFRSPFNQRLVTFRNSSTYVNRQPGPKY